VRYRAWLGARGDAPLGLQPRPRRASVTASARCAMVSNCHACGRAMQRSRWRASVGGGCASGAAAAGVLARRRARPSHGFEPKPPVVDFPTAHHGRCQPRGRWLLVGPRGGTEFPGCQLDNPTWGYLTSRRRVSCICRFPLGFLSHVSVRRVPPGAERFQCFAGGVLRRAFLSSRHGAGCGERVARAVVSIARRSELRRCEPGAR